MNEQTFVVNRTDCGVCGFGTGSGVMLRPQMAHLQFQSLFGTRLGASLTQDAFGAVLALTGVVGHVYVHGTYLFAGSAIDAQRFVALYA